ncbi:MAG: hypothetical protein QM490_06110 [Candidatus Gracilibacteria bacterium]
MFQVSKISSKLYGIVGLRQPFNPTYAILDASNQISRSGYYITDNAHVKLECLKDTQDYKDISDTDFNEYLKRLQQSSIVNVCHNVFNDYDYIDRNLLYTNTQNKVNTEILDDGFVGYKIEVDDKNDIAFSIKRVLLDFDTTGSFNILLFNTSKSTPIESKAITITDKTQEVVLDWKIDNSDITYKGDYYLGYIKTATTPIPYMRNYEDSNEMTTFSNLEFEKVQVVNHNTETLFDLTSEVSMSKNIGINPDITVYEDFTDLIINNEMLFARAIYLDMSISVLREQLNSLRINSNQITAESQSMKILAEIEGIKGDNPLKLVGLRSLLIGEIKQISVEINKLKNGYFNSPLSVKTVIGFIQK